MTIMTELEQDIIQCISCGAFIDITEEEPPECPCCGESLED